MTGIVAAIIELKAHCRHASELIASLERFAVVVEDAHAPVPTVPPSATPTPTVTVAAAETTRRTPAASVRATSPRKANGKLAKPPAKPARPGKVGRAAAAFTAGAEILRILGARAEPLAPKDIIRLTKLPRWKGMKLIIELANAGSLVRIGHHRNATYTLAHHPRSGAAAGTQAAPPAGPSPTNGSTPAHPRVAASAAPAPGGFEVAWNGTKERNGDAPSLVGDREIRR